MSPPSRPTATAGARAKPRPPHAANASHEPRRLRPRRAHPLLRATAHRRTPPSAVPRRPSPPARRLAEQLFDQEIPLTIVEAAFLLAIARRGARPPELPPL